MTTFWCEWAWLGGDRPEPGVEILVSGDRFAEIAHPTAPRPDAVRLSGLTVPGIANVHSHAFHRALRGRTHSGTGSFWTWRDRMYELALDLDPDSYRGLATQVFQEMLASGYTAVGEFHYLHHQPGGAAYADPNAMSRAILEAAAETGIRITLLDALYLFGGLDQDYVAPQGAQRRYSDGSAEAWTERVDALHVASPTQRVGAAIHSVRAVDPEAMAIVGDYARRRALPLHIHLSEQPAENDRCLAVHGVTPTMLLDSVGLVDENLTAVHATHLDEADISRLGAGRATACFCPTTERDLADGIGPSAALAAAGARLCVGSDSHAVIDPLEELRAVELNQRLATLTRGNHSVPDLLTAGTVNGYRALGWDGGRIERGSLADLVTISIREDVAPEHILATAIFAGARCDVTHTFVGGSLVYQNSQG